MAVPQPLEARQFHVSLVVLAATVQHGVKPLLRLAALQVSIVQHPQPSPSRWQSLVPWWPLKQSRMCRISSSAQEITVGRATTAQQRVEPLSPARLVDTVLFRWR